MTRETWYLSHAGGLPTLRLAVNGGGESADFTAIVKPGGSMFGVGYAEWRKTPPGPVVIVRRDDGTRTLEADRG